MTTKRTTIYQIALLLGAVLLSWLPTVHAQDNRNKQEKPVSRRLSAQERRAAADEAKVQLELLRGACKFDVATHVGIAQKDGRIIDPSSEMMRSLLTSYPKVKPASDLADPNAKKDKFNLFTVSVAQWESKDLFKIDTLYLSEGGGLSDGTFDATRTKVSKTNPTGWEISTRPSGYGDWTGVYIQRNGTWVVVEPQRKKQQQ